MFERKKGYFRPKNIVSFCEGTTKNYNEVRFYIFLCSQHQPQVLGHTAELNVNPKFC
jgi:hypothetical protein